MLLEKFVNTCVILLEVYDQPHIGRFLLTLLACSSLLTGSWVILHKKVVWSVVHASNIIYIIFKLYLNRTPSIIILCHKNELKKKQTINFMLPHSRYAKECLASFELIDVIGNNFGTQTIIKHMKKKELSCSI